MKFSRVKLLSTALSLAFLASCSQPVTQTIPAKNVAEIQNSGNSDEVAAYYSKLKREDKKEEDIPPQPIDGTKADFLPKAEANKDLTYFTYEALDNNLYKDLNRIVNTLEYVGSNKNLNLLAQTDSWKENNTARYYITNDTDFSKIKSAYTQLGPEAESSGDAKVFSDAINWAYSTYPSSKRWLNLSTHGAGFYGVGFDDHPESYMNLVQLGQALKQGLKNKKLDIVSFDACLMATVEVASELKDVAGYMVGSEDSTFYWGYGYYQTFSKIAKNPALSPDQIVRSLVLDVNNKGAANQTYTISATDLSKVNTLEDGLDKLAKALRKALPQQRDNILRALQQSKPFVQADDYPFRDINRVVKLLKDNVKDNDVATACDNLNNIMYRKGVIMLSRQSKAENDLGRGLSIYVPLKGKVNDLYRTTGFAKETQWDEFLVDLNATIKPEPTQGN